MSRFDDILKLTKQLYPTGRAFRMAEGKTITKFMYALGKSEARAYDFAESTLFRILADNDNFTEEDASLWEARLNLKVDPGVDLETRKALINRKYSYPGGEIYRQNYQFIENQLREAGYNVWVHENRFPDGSGGYYYDDVLTDGGTQHSDDVEHSEDVEFGGGNLDLVANYPISGEQFNIGDDENQKGTFFIGGQNYPDRAIVRPDLEIEFRKLVLTLKPANTVAILLIDFTASGNIVGIGGDNIIGVEGGNIITVG